MIFKHLVFMRGYVQIVYLIVNFASRFEIFK